MCVCCVCVCCGCVCCGCVCAVFYVQHWGASLCACSVCACSVCVCVCGLCISMNSDNPLMTCGLPVFQRAYTLIVEAWDWDNGTHSNSGKYCSIYSIPPCSIYLYTLLYIPCYIYHPALYTYIPCSIYPVLYTTMFYIPPCSIDHPVLYTTLLYIPIYPALFPTSSTSITDDSLKEVTSYVRDQRISSLVPLITQTHTHTHAHKHRIPSIQ